MSIRIKLALTLAALGAGAALISGYIGYHNAQESLTRAVWQEVRGVRRARAQQVEAYLRTVEQHTDTLSESRNFIEAMDEFRAGALMWLRENRRALAERHPNRWIAVYENRVIASEARFDALARQLPVDPQRAAFAFVAVGPWA